jgi:hypothetical protein
VSDLINLTTAAEFYSIRRRKVSREEQKGGDIPTDGGNVNQ